MEKNDKAKIMASLMRNKGVSQAFKDAMDAPIGSTKRKKAQKIVSVLRKTISKHDAKGGPGLQGFSPSTPSGYVPQAQMSQPQQETGGMVIFSAPPSPYDGQGGPGIMDQFTQTAQRNASTLTSGGQNAISGLLSAFNPANRAAPTTNANVAPNPLTLLSSQPAPSLSRPATPAAPAPGPMTPYQNMAPAPAASSAPSGGMTPVPADGGYRAPVQQQPQQNIPQPLQNNPDFVPAIPEASGTPTTTNTSLGGYSNLSSLASSALDASLGPTTFAYATMNDINALRELMPGVPDDQLPVGASLAGQIIGLKNALRKEHDIDGLTSRLNQKLTQGMTLEDDLKDYIRGKDEYLNEIDGMLTAARRTYLDRSGGPDAGVMGNYVDYLTTLKGRQNKRYIEFYNGAINQYKAELQTLQSQLQTATSAYESELSDRSTLMQDDYNRIFTGLTEMYNAAEGAPRKQLELQILQAQLAESLGSIGDTALGSEKWISEYGNLKNQGVLIDKDTNALMSSVTALEPAIETIVSNQQTSLGGALRIIGEAITNDLSQSGGDLNSYMQKVKRYDQMVTELKRQSIDPSVQAKYGADFSPSVDALASNLASTAGQAISAYVLGNASKIKDAVKPLSSGTGFMGWGGIPTREKYVKSKAGGLSEELLGGLYDYYSSINNADPTGNTMKQIISLPDNQFAPIISNGLAGALFGGASAVSALQGM